MSPTFYNLSENILLLPKKTILKFFSDITVVNLLRVIKKGKINILRQVTCFGQWTSSDPKEKQKQNYCEMNIVNNYIMK